ncbi:MAG TPA: universal stress protein [Candidatus Tumulicola sp.]|jgi:nucleotide-binding universal stress UspA family protein
MMRCVLAATDGSAASLRAVETAIELVRSFGPDARLHVATVLDYADVPGTMGKHPPGVPDLLAELADAALAQAAGAVATAGVTAEMHRLSGDVVDALLACAARIGADLVVAGFHGRNRIARLVIGSVSGRLVRSSAVPVVVVARRAPAETETPPVR